MTTAELSQLTQGLTGHDCSRELSSRKLVFWLAGGRAFKRDQADLWREVNFDPEGKDS